MTFKIRYAPSSVGVDNGALQINSSDLDAPVLLFNIIGEGTGCPDGWWEIDGDPANGCEYQCILTNGGVEACDGIDNDCDAGYCGGSPCAAGIDEDCI